jgi:hypothetical protein
VKLQGAEDLDELISRVDRAEKRTAELEKELALADSHTADHERLESVLKQRAKVVRELEEELVRRDRLVRDLAGALEEAHGSPPEGPQSAPAGPAEGALRERLDALALDLARREADARAAGWTIAELERRLAIAEQGAAEGDVGAKLSAAQDELDALRKALVQEHEARRRAEGQSKEASSGDSGERGEEPGREGAEGRAGSGPGRREHDEGRHGT